MDANVGLEFVDTNVLVYAYDQSAEEKHRQAKALLERLWHSRTGCLSIQVLQEFYVTVTQKVSQPVSRDVAAQIVADLGVWRFHTPQVTDIVMAVGWQNRHQVSFWDAMILHSAAQLGCEIVWSEDLNNGQVYQKIRVLNPFVRTP